MELILKKTIEELIPKSISWNNTEALAEVNTLLVRYRSKVYTDDNIAEAKADRARLNAFSKALNGGRLSIKRLYDEPYLKFKAEVDEIITAVNNVSVTIDSQIKEKEEADKAAKYDALEAHWVRSAGEFLRFVPYAKIHDPRWLNVSVKETAAQAEMDARITDIKRSLAAIEAMPDENDMDKNTLITLFYRSLNFAEAIRQNEELKAERKRVTMLKEKQNKVVSVSVETEKSTQKQYYISFEVQGTEAQIKALSAYLKAQNITYKQI